MQQYYIQHALKYRHNNVVFFSKTPLKIFFICYNIQDMINIFDTGKKINCFLYGFILWALGK